MAEPDFNRLAAIVHMGRCRGSGGDCKHLNDSTYFTVKDNDVASTVWTYFVQPLVAAVRAEERNRVTVEDIERTMFYGIGDHSPAVQPCCRRAAAAAVHRLYSGEAP